jgi:hypothetical protein
VRRLSKLFNRIFRLEKINGDGICPTYLYRWTLLPGRWFKVYLHHFVGDDWAKDLHDHPKRFISIGLRGQYIEETPTGEREYCAPWIRTFPATHTHRLRMLNGGECWTLVIVFRSVRQWGFWHQGTWIHWRSYVDSPTAQHRKSCE